MSTRLFLAASAALLLAAQGAAAQTADAADAAWAAGEHDRARTLYAARVAADSADTTALHRLGLLLGWNSEYAESIRLLDRLMQVRPTEAARMDRANVLAWSRSFDRALDDVAELIRADSTSVAAWTARARFLSWAGRYDASLAAYDRLQRMDPADPEIPRARARVLSWAGRLDAAEEAYRAILEQDPADADAMRGLARVASWRGDLGGGETLWRRALSADPDNADARVGLSQVLRWRGQARAALLEAREAVRLAPDSRDALQQLAWAEAAFAPRVAPAVSVEGDSDDNTLVTTSLTATTYIARRMSVSAHGYVRRAEDLRVQGGSLPQSRAISVSTRTDVGGGWMLGAGGGVIDRNTTGADAAATWSASLASPAWRTLSASVGYTRSMLDGTALLIERGVRTDEGTAALNLQLSSAVRAEAGASLARFRGTQDNERLLGRAGLDVRITPSLHLRPRATAFRFDDDLEEGYFDPDFYGLAELGVGLSRYRGAWAFSAEVAPGAQQVGSEGGVRGALSARARVGVTLAPGREVGISLAMSNLGIERFQADATGYRYQAAVISAVFGL